MKRADKDDTDSKFGFGKLPLALVLVSLGFWLCIHHDPVGSTPEWWRWFDKCYTNKFNVAGKQTQWQKSHNSLNGPSIHVSFAVLGPSLSLSAVGSSRCSKDTCGPPLYVDILDGTVMHFWSSLAKKWKSSAYNFSFSSRWPFSLKGKQSSLYLLKAMSSVSNKFEYRTKDGKINHLSKSLYKILSRFFFHLIVGHLPNALRNKNNMSKNPWKQGSKILQNVLKYL